MIRLVKFENVILGVIIVVALFLSLQIFSQNKKYKKVLHEYFLLQKYIITEKAHEGDPVAFPKLTSLYNENNTFSWEAIKSQYEPFAKFIILNVSLFSK